VALLEGDDLKAEAVASAEEALASIERCPPQLVVTDLKMPGMSGLELVETIQARFPAVPVVLMTAYGNEQTAFEALQLGAASYIPKSQLFDELPDTVDNLLALGRSRREKARVVQYMSTWESRFVLDNDPGLIPPLVAYFEDILELHFGPAHQNAVMQVGVALSEALLNAIHHGNLEVGSDLRERDLKAYYDLVEQRRDEDPYQDRRIDLTATISRSSVSYSVTDEGPGFTLSALPDPGDPANLLKVSGRGLVLITTFMDDVAHNEKGNRITMVKNFPAPSER
jgi:CheY-like chemotaxis protein